MAEYTTYSTVSWSDGTPISSDRLQQMSTNSEAIKTTTQTYAKGVLARQEFGTAGSALTDTTADPVIALNDSTTYDRNGDNRLTIGANRLFRITFSIAGVNFGAVEDDQRLYYFRLVEGTSNSDTMLAQWNFAAPSDATSSLRVAGGDYSVLLESGATGKTSAVYTVFMSREAGTVSYNSYASSTSKKQLTAEDCGSY